MKIALIISAALLAGFAGFAQGTLTIKGKVNGDTKGYNKVYLYGTGVQADSVTISNGEFEFNLPYVKGIVPLFYTEYSVKVNRMYSPFAALADGPGVLTLKDVDITKGINSGKWSGIRSAEEYQQLNDSITLIYIAVNRELSARQPSNNVAGRVSVISGRNPEHQNARDSLIKIKMAVVFTDFVTKHPDSYASAFGLSGIGRSTLSVKDLERIFGLLSRNRKQSEAGKNLSDYLAGLRSSTIGSYVKNFTLNTPEEKPLSLSSLKGKYVMIDFWASWCGPCKQSFPHMKEVYQKYKGDKFEIYSISIDKDKAAWLKELKAQGLPWLHALDTANISQSGFAVTGVPTTYLIDPQGKIIMKEVGFEPGGNSPLEKKLAELFGNKNFN